MMRRRDAPMAARTASSRVRTVARARRRLATFAQQIRRTNPTTPKKSSAVRRRSLPISALWSGSMMMPRPWLVAGSSRASPSATASKSDRAASMVTPDLSRPIARSP